MTEIWITTQFEALHCWTAAPDAVDFLRTPHRHLFHVKVWMPVNNDNRDIEFILFKRQVDATIEVCRGCTESMTWSCETWARRIGQELGAVAVSVSEDGENGAEWVSETRFNRRAD